MSDMEEDPSEGSPELFAPFFPFTYYWRRAGEKDPPSVPEFLDKNYRYLAIAGVFAAIVVYLSELTTEPGPQVVVGMVGAGVLFTFALMSVVHNGIIALTRASRQRSLIHGAIFAYMLFALLFIGISLASSFARYPATSRALDGLFAVTTIVVYLMLLRARVTVPEQFQTDKEYTFELGRLSHFVANKSLKIASLILILVVPASKRGLFGLPDITSVYRWDSNFIAISAVVVSIFALTAIIFASAIIGHGLYLRIKGLLPLD